ncbi:MAG TPA: MauE/DoxX family redox-associated membrane protein [Hanamia sp.]|nr:MauE/DoxX family redox-associated membrane protein [Hanamia sp.]
MDSRSTNSTPLRNDLKISKATFLADIISGVLSLLFLYTALSKLTDHKVFKNVLTASPLLKPYAALIAWLLPVTEIAIVVLLFIPRFRIKGLIASLILITLFTIYLLYMIAFTPHLPCNCGGVIKLLTWPQHIVFNLFFIFLSLIGIVLYRRAKNLQSNSPP